MDRSLHRRDPLVVIGLIVAVSIGVVLVAIAVWFVYDNVISGASLKEPRGAYLSFAAAAFGLGLVTVALVYRRTSAPALTVAAIVGGGVLAVLSLAIYPQSTDAELNVVGRGEIDVGVERLTGVWSDDGEVLKLLGSDVSEHGCGSSGVIVTVDLETLEVTDVVVMNEMSSPPTSITPLAREFVRPPSTSGIASGAPAPPKYVAFDGAVVRNCTN